MTDSPRLEVSRAVPGAVRLARGEEIWEVADETLTDLAAAVAAGMTRPPDGGDPGGGFEADRVWLAQLSSVATMEERIALLRNADRIWLSVVFLLMQDDLGFLAAFRDSVSARTWPMLFEDCRQLAMGAVRTLTVRQAVESVRAQCLTLQFQGLFRRKRGWLGGTVPVIDFGSPKPIPEDPEPPYAATVGTAAFVPLERQSYPRTARLTLGETSLEVRLEEAFRLRAMALALSALDEGPEVFRRAWVTQSVREAAALGEGALMEWRRSLDPPQAAALVVLADGRDLPARLLAPVSPMARDAVERLAARWREDGVPGAVVDAGEAALARLWCLAADGGCEIFPGGGLHGFVLPERAHWFAEVEIGEDGA